MLDSFLTFINQQKWNLAGQKTLLAISGGVDSVVMLHLFHKAGLDAGVAHCNFGLRGVESNEDEEFVKELAARYNYPVHVKCFETKSFAETNSMSTQMAARQLRYAWFEELIERHSFSMVATAHHVNDSLETTLLNLARGTGLAGMHGIPVRNGNIIRPLLFATRTEIQEYLDQNDLVWREDRSNRTTDYKRNLIRHKVIPVLREINPALEHTFEASSERLGAADKLLESFMTVWKQDVLESVDGELQINIKKLLSSEEPTYGLWFILRDYGFNYQQMNQLLDSAHGLSGKIFHSPSHTVLKNRDWFVIREINASKSFFAGEISEETGTHWFGNTQVVVNIFRRDDSFELVKSSDMVFVDLDSLVFPLTIRTWEKGDVFYPFGMAGKKKKISDLLIDSKVSVFEKEDIRVLQSGNGEIVWVIGMRSDERFRITDKTRQIMSIRIWDHLLRS
jgi:tRNA(Ile)-lysidine synthase